MSLARYLLADDDEEFCPVCHDERPCSCDRTTETEHGDWPDFDEEQSGRC